MSGKDWSGQESDHNKMGRIQESQGSLRRSLQKGAMAMPAPPNFPLADLKSHLLDYFQIFDEHRPQHPDGIRAGHGRVTTQMDHREGANTALALDHVETFLAPRLHST